MQTNWLDFSSKAISLLRDLESITAELLDSLKERTGVRVPRVVTTMNDVKEDPDSSISGKYHPISRTMLLNYKAELMHVIHLYSHHMQAMRLGVDRYMAMADEEELRLPWVMRGLEHEANRAAATLINQLDPRIKMEWENNRKYIAKTLDKMKSTAEFGQKWIINDNEFTGREP